MKGGNKLFIFAGVGLALVAILLAVVSMTGSKATDAEQQGQSTKVKVVQAKADVPAYQILTVEDLTVVELPSNEAPADAVASLTSAVGQAYRVPLALGQTLQASQIVAPGLRNDIAAGKRAMALPVNEVSMLSGLVQEGDYVDIVFNARINLIRHLPTTSAEIPEDAIYELKEPMVIPPDLEQPNHPTAGEPGSEFEIRDDVGDAGQLEPVAKIMLQDIKILRVVRPGETYQGNGSKDATAAEAEAPAQDQAMLGQVILEVTPEQAEFVTFIQNQRQSYQLIVRAKDDHATTDTTGVTYSILATEPTWALPWPERVIAPLEQGGSAEADSESAEDEVAPDATPEASS